MNDTDIPSEQKRLAVLSLGFYLRPRLRHILGLYGWQVVPGWNVKTCDAVGVWGRKPIAKRGLMLAEAYNKPVLNIEDAFLRSVEPGHTGAPPLGLLTDRSAPHFDVTAVSELEEMLQSGNLSDPRLLERARTGMASLRQLRLSKYNAWQDGELPKPGFILVIDQTVGDASIRFGGAEKNAFATMLQAAKTENPEKRILIRTHPVSAAKAKAGHYTQADCDWRTSLYTDPVNPWDLLEGASKVYCVTSQMGFEAMYAGHKPIVFGQPFYAGWGLTEDRAPLARRSTKRSLEQVFAATMLQYPNWYDPCRDKISSFEDTLLQLDAERRAWQENFVGKVCVGMKPWKHRPVAAFLKGRGGKPKFENDPAKAVELASTTGREVVVWAGKETPELTNACEHANVRLVRMEDGFLRSVGLGANLLPAASLVLDDLGIYFDPRRPSRLETMIETQKLTAEQRLRADALRKRLVRERVTKYNVGTEAPMITTKTGQRRILVPGQVEDDASIRLGTDEVSTNVDLLRWAKAHFPNDFIVYKPHPDVEAGLREGAVSDADLKILADFVAHDMSAADLIEKTEVVWTMTSLMGFEALLRGKEVHCLGRPFYAGWGLTHDHDQDFPRRTSKPDLQGLIHAALIEYPRYFDPVSKLPCPPEVVMDRLAARVPEVSSNPALRMRWLAALQYKFRHLSHLWR